MPMSDARLQIICSHAVGGLITLALIVLIVVIGLGHVEEKTSYGLMPLTVALSNMAVLYGQWAWRGNKETADQNLPK